MACPKLKIESSILKLFAQTFLTIWFNVKTFNYIFSSAWHPPQFFSTWRLLLHQNGLKLIQKCKFMCANNHNLEKKFLRQKNDWSFGWLKMIQNEGEILHVCLTWWAFILKSCQNHHLLFFELIFFLRSILFNHIPLSETFFRSVKSEYFIWIC